MTHMHGVAQPNVKMSHTMGEVITWIKASFQKIYDNNMENNKIRGIMNKCIEILGKPQWLM